MFIHCVFVSFSMIVSLFVDGVMFQQLQKHFYIYFLRGFTVFYFDIELDVDYYMEATPLYILAFA